MIKESQEKVRDLVERISSAQQKVTQEIKIYFYKNAGRIFPLKSAI